MKLQEMLHLGGTSWMGSKVLTYTVNVILSRDRLP